MDSKDENHEKIKDIFAPAKGLERGKDGKIQVDKEKVEAAPAKDEKSSDKASKQSDTTTSSVSEPDVQKASPVKRMTLMERQAKEAADKKAALEAKRATETEDKLGATMSGGLRAPSRLAKPTATSALKATEDRKAKLLEK